MIGAFGDLVFSVSADQVYTFFDLAMSASYRTEENEVIGSRPSTYRKGPDLESLSFKITLDAALGIDVRTEIDRWRNLCNAGVPQIFSIEGVSVSDFPYLLQSVNPEVKNITGSGVMTRAELSVQMKEYVREGYPQNESQTFSTGLDDTVSQKLFASNPDLIRDNSQYDEAVITGLVDDKNLSQLLSEV